MGHGSWDAYLEAEHGVIPLGQKRWSDERLHWTIATLAKKYPPEEGWTYKENPVLRGTTLRSLYYKARYNNNTGNQKASKLSRSELFFGHGSWEKYLAWNRQNYKV